MNLDRRPYVYRVHDRDGLIYIGSTIRLWRRFEEHRRDAWWAETAVRVHARLCPTAEEARRIERQAIYDEVPRWNLNDLRPRLRFMNEDQWDDYLVRFTTARRNEAEWRRRKGLRALTHFEHQPLGLDWLIRRYRFQFGKDYDPTRLEVAA